MILELLGFTKPAFDAFILKRLQISWGWFSQKSARYLLLHILYIYLIYIYYTQKYEVLSAEDLAKHLITTVYSLVLHDGVVALLG